MFLEHILQAFVVFLLFDRGFLLAVRKLARSRLGTYLE